MVGEKFGIEGNISETWETAFSAETGEYIGSMVTYGDGTMKRDGSYLVEAEALGETNGTCFRDQS